MKRFHVHVSVRDLAQSVQFYSKVFGASPTVLKADYAKWMLEDPRVNFAISQREAKLGVDHLGLQVDSGEELTALEAQLRAADASLVPEMNTTCCYAQSDKYWVTDPQGVAWETFHSLGEAPVFGSSPAAAKTACCAPKSSSLAAIPIVAASNSGCCG